MKFINDDELRQILNQNISKSSEERNALSTKVESEMFTFSIHDLEIPAKVLSSTNILDVQQITHIATAYHTQRLTQNVLEDVSRLGVDTATFPKVWSKIVADLMYLKVRSYALTGEIK